MSMFLNGGFGKSLAAKLKHSLHLTKAAWSYLRLDSELFVLPIIMAVWLVFLYIVLAISLLLLGDLPNLRTGTIGTAQVTIFMLGAYILTAYSVTWCRAIVAYTVAKRSDGGNASLGQSMWQTMKLAPYLFVWTLVNGSAGVIVRTFVNNSVTADRLVASALGANFNALTFFIIPATVVNKMSLKAAGHESVRRIEETWGKGWQTNITIQVAFRFLHVLMVGLFFGSFFVGVLGQWPILFVCVTIVYMAWLLLALPLEVVLSTIVCTLLYQYADKKVLPKDFPADLLLSVLKNEDAVS